ncbi:MAG: response regulator [Lewinellaceae bacterium]|nr:response regulator [Lewinellaceae bacterium]
MNKLLVGNYQAALQELLEAEDHFRSVMSKADLWNRCRFFSTLGTTYLGLGQTKKAIETAQTGLGLANGNLFGALGNLEVLYKAYEAQGNYQKAFDYYRSFTATQDSIVQLRNSQEVTRLELENQFQQQRLADSLQLATQNYERELSYQAQINQQKTTRNILIGLGTLAILLSLGLVSRLRYTRRAQAILQEKNRMIESEKEKAQASEQAKHLFLANMSHEIRTPMNAIKGMTDILLRREPQTEQLSYLNAIKESSNSLLVIINDILDMSKIEAGKIDLERIPFSVEQVIQNVQTITQFKAEEKGLLLQTNISENTPAYVQGDPTRLHQVLLNLVGNAIKFTEKGVVTIQLKTGMVEAENKVMAHFCVSDTGVGIGAGRMEKIFETFEQAYSDTSRKFGGTGLGLSISKKLVEIQQGEIWAESQKGKGSKFFFSIPYELSHQAKDSTAIPAAADNHAATLKAIKVLLVEDNQFNAIVAQEELEDAIEEVLVEVAENGVIAVEKVSHTDFDIILMDVQMPVMNGYEATKAIRDLSNGKSQIPIIAMTANVMKEEVERCYEAGMNDFIGKPFDIEDLLSKIKKLLGKS